MTELFENVPPRPEVITDGATVTGWPIEDLHRVAAEAGLDRKQYFDRIGVPHYYLTGEDETARAVAAGARKVTSMELIRLIRLHKEGGSK